MICRRCGAELPDNAIRCSNCGIRVNMYCPECKTINVFGSKSCKNCGFDLLKPCPVCGSLNIYSATECRKCHTSLEKYQTVSKDESKDVSDFEVVRPFCSEQSAYVKHEFITGVESIIEETNQNTENNTTDENIPLVETIPVSEDDSDSERIFNIEDENPDVNETEIKPEDNTTETEVENQFQDEDGFISENIKIDYIEEYDSAVAKTLYDLDNKEEKIVEVYDSSVEKSINNSDESNSSDDSEDSEDDSLIEVQPEAVLKAINLIKNSLVKNIIAINGNEGSGKSAVLKQVADRLSRKGFLSLYGSCTPLVQITSFGFFQDALLRIMGFPPYTNSTESFIKDFKKSNFSKVFSFLDGSELTLFLNIFYPSQKDNFENILANKQKMFSILEKVIKSFLVNNNLIISIDNFELLDGASYEFIIHMMQKGFFNNRLKLLVAYQENKSIQSYFDMTNLDENMFETILIKKFTKEDLIKTVSKSTYIKIDEIFDEEHIDEMVRKSDGNAIRMEQEVALLFDSGYISLKDNDIVINEDNKPEFSPISFEELIKLRLNFLNPSAKNVLFMAAIMGYRFATSILCLAVTMPVNKAEKMLDYLIQEMFIEKVDNYTCEFKSLTLWKLIYQEAKKDLLYKENSERLYLSLKPLILSSNLQKLISCSEAISKNEAFLIWQSTASITAKLGDTNLYVIAQKQCLKILEEQDVADSEIIKTQIYEEIGKLLCEKSPSEAVTYLANVLDFEIKESNVRKVIDLSGYFIKSCYLTGNYFGVTEAVDTIIKCIDSVQANVSGLDRALINTRKLKALLNIGNSEQIVNLVNEDIIPELDKGLNLKPIETSYRNIIINAWLISKIALAKAYSLQGNNQVLNTISEIREFIEKYNYNSNYYSTQVDIIDAFAKTILGDINKSNELLNNIAASYKDKNMEKNLLAEWNLINIINRVLSGQKNDLKVDLFELAAYTNNINEHFIKNIIKLILGSVLKEEGNTIKALEIYNEEITYFAKEKVAIGALLSWALIVKLSMETGEDDKALNTATKSLEIAQSPKINNYFFIIYFQKYLAEIYQRKGDLAAAKMYLEKSIMLAKQFELKYQLIELYIAYAKYTEEVMKNKHIYSSENVRTASELYNKAVLLAKELRLPNMIEFATRERSGFKTFCQLNSIEI